MSFDPEDFDESEPPDLEDYPTLQAVARFAQAVPHVPWFLHLGEPLTAEAIDAAKNPRPRIGIP